MFISLLSAIFTLGIEKVCVFGQCVMHSVFLVIESVCAFEVNRHTWLQEFPFLEVLAMDNMDGELAIYLSNNRMHMPSIFVACNLIFFFFSISYQRGTDPSFDRGMSAIPWRQLHLILVCHTLLIFFQGFYADR